MNEIIVPARAHSHGAAKPKKHKKGMNGPIGYVKVNESVWTAIREVAQLRIGGRDFRTIDIETSGKVTISNWEAPRK